MAARAGKPLRADRTGEFRTALEKNRRIIYATQTVCGICGKPVDMSIRYPHPLSPTIDHIIPIAKGGHPSALENLQLAHRWCNRQKSDKFFAIKQVGEEAEIANKDLPLHYDWKNYKASALPDT